VSHPEEAGADGTCKDALLVKNVVYFYKVPPGQVGSFPF